MMVLAESGGGSWLLEWLQSFAGNPWLLLPALALATFVSEDLACIFAGVLAAQDWVSIWEAMAACAVGIWLGDIGLYWVGYLATNTRKH